MEQNLRGGGTSPGDPSWGNTLYVNRPAYVSEHSTTTPSMNRFDEPCEKIIHSCLDEKCWPYYCSGLVQGITWLLVRAGCCPCSVHSRTCFEEPGFFCNCGCPRFCFSLWILLFVICCLTTILILYFKEGDAIAAFFVSS